jgi:hypothetical protein
MPHATTLRRNEIFVAIVAAWRETPPFWFIMVEAP